MFEKLFVKIKIFSYLQLNMLVLIDHFTWTHWNQLHVAETPDIPSEDGLKNQIKLSMKLSFEPWLIRKTYRPALVTSPSIGTLTAAQCPLSAESPACRTSASIISKVTDRRVLPSRRTPWDPQDGWMDGWSETGRLYIDLMLAAFALGGMQQPERTLRFRNSCWRKGRRAPDDQEEEEENRKIWKRIESFSLSTNQRFELVECICNPVSSERRWIIHIFRSQNNYASPSSTGLTSNRFEIDVSIVVHPCEKDSCNHSCQCFPQHTGGLRSTAQRRPFTRLPSLPEPLSWWSQTGGWPSERSAGTIVHERSGACEEPRPPRARTRIPSHTQWRLTFFDVKRTRTCEVGVWPAGWGGMAAMSEM